MNITKTLPHPSKTSNKFSAVLRLQLIGSVRNSFVEATSSHSGMLPLAIDQFMQAKIFWNVDDHQLTAVVQHPGAV